MNLLHHTNKNDFGITKFVVLSPDPFGQGFEHNNIGIKFCKWWHIYIATLAFFVVTSDKIKFKTLTFIHIVLHFKHQPLTLRQGWCEMLLFPGLNYMHDIDLRSVLQIQILTYILFHALQSTGDIRNKRNLSYHGARSY